MADDSGSDFSPIDLGALGLLGARGMAGAGSLIKSAGYPLGRAVGMLSRGAAGPWGLGAAGMYEIAKPQPAGAGEADQYVRGPDGQLVPNPKADHTLLGEAPAPTGQTDPSAPGADAGTPVADASAGGDPWLGKSAMDLAGPIDATSTQDLSARANAPKAPKVASGAASNGGRAGNPTPNAPSSGGGSFFGSFGDKIRQHSNMLLGLGAGLAGKRSFGEAMSGGFSGAATGNQADIAQGMQQGGIRAAYQELVSRGIDPNVALAAAYNKDLYAALIKQGYPEDKVVSTGTDMNGVEHKGVQRGQYIIPMDRAMAPQPVHSFEEALRLPKKVLFSLPDGRVFER